MGTRSGSRLWRTGFATASIWFVAFAACLACGGDGERAAVSIVPIEAPIEATRAAAAAPVGSGAAPAATAAPNLEPERTAEPSPVAGPAITLAAVGDLMFARDVVVLMREQGVLYPFARALSLFDGADLLVGNLEGTFTDRGEALDKRYTFRAPPELAEALALTGFDAVSLANNHSFDFGEVGLGDTLAALESVGVASFGAGADRAAALAPALIEVRGETIALLGLSDISGARPAGAGSPGVASASGDVAAAVQAAAGRADYVVVAFHWGTEYVSAPTARQRELARTAIDAGADVVLGHHPHVLQPWERYGDGLILYSLGNFVFDLDAGDLRTLGSEPFETAVAVVTLAPGAPPAVEFRPAYIDVDENRPRRASGAEADAALASLHELTPSVRVDRSAARGGAP